MKKLWFILLLIPLTAVLLAGCATTADTLPSPTPLRETTSPATVPPSAGMPTAMAPNPMASGDPLMPGASMMPGLGNGIETVEDARRVSEGIKDSVEKLTEVNDAFVVAAGNTALVGLQFTSQYQGEVDERLQKMVLSRAQAVEKTITGVAVTRDEKQVQQIKSLLDTLQSAASLDAVRVQAQELQSQIAVYPQ